MASEAGPRVVQTGNATLAPPVNNDLSMRRPMERTPSMAIRAEKEDLKEAAEDSFNVILDLNLDGNVRWVSPSWEDVIGTTRESVQDKPIAAILLDDKDAFKNAVETMQNDDSRSFKVRFSVLVGPKSKLARDPAAAAALASEEEAFPMEGVKEEENILTLEGQGILIYDKSSGEASHTMWVIRPFVEPNEITIDLPPVLVESLGVGAGMLARYLTSLAEQGAVDPANNPPPMPVLCRICERQIQPWWFEKHSELCMLEHKAESDVQLCQENLGMHRHAIVKILDAMERRSSRPVSGEISVAPSPIEYRGLPIGPSSSTPSSGTASPGTPPPRPRDSSAGGLGRSRSFPARRPLVRIVELLLDLCDTAMEISTPAIKESYGAVELGTFRTQSPQSEARINQVLQWSSPTTNTLDEEKGLALLCQDSEAVAKAKVEAVFRHRNTIEYSERIRLEFSMLVQDCIDEALRKASELASDAPDEEYSDGSDIEDDTPFFAASFGPALQRSNSSLGPPRGRLRRHSSPAGSGSTSPMECSTPKSQQSLKRMNSRRQKAVHRTSMHFENEGADSDTSGRSSLAAAMGHPQTESPVSDHELTVSRVYAATRDKKRQNYPSMTGGNSPRRQASPARIAPSSSPLRIQKPRSVLYDSMPTPITSPLLSTGDFSPALDAFHHHNHHHKRQSSVTSSDQFGKPPVSPRLSGVNPTQQNRAVPPSIKDFEIIKPISKGAFGSVYLSKKKSTGDYFAIKVLKKADMIAKNQVTNVRAERAIMMVQGESDFVAKLFWTFASKDYLYLVMEYLNGGDCAALIKVLSGLPEDWAQKYLAEVVLGVEHLHSRGIVHRDLKPDNLLIDQKGHLKLTDFGLSRMGLLGRQKRAQTQSSESTPDLLKQGPFARSKSVASSRSTSFDFPPNNSPSSTPLITPDANAQLVTPSYFNLSRENTLSRENSLRRSSNPRSDTSGSDHLISMLGSFSLNDPYMHSTLFHNRKTPIGDEDVQSESSTSSDFSNGLCLQHMTSYPSPAQSQIQHPPQPMMPPQLALFDPEDNNRKFVGTPDYLAPETIKGSGQDEMSDWWSLGCILFEFLYGYPPFHADTHDKVFENILNRRIDWPDPEDDDISDEAKHLMNRLMCTDPNQRLGANGAEEVKKHPWFANLNWETLLEEQPSFVPTPQDPEDTEYFDSRGATLQSFVEEFEDQSASPQALTPGADLPERPHDAVSRTRREVNSNKRGLMPLSIPPHVREGRNRRLSEPNAQDDFGSFAFKNLPVLEKANKDVIQKLRTEALKSTPALATSNPSSPSAEGSPILSSKSLSRTLSNPSKNGGKRPVSPSNLHHPNSSPARASQPSSPLLMSFTATGISEKRKASNASASSSVSQNSSSQPSIGQQPTMAPQPGPFVDIPRLSTTAKSTQSSSAASSPVKTQPKVPAPISTSTSPTKSSHDKLLLGSAGSQPSPSKNPLHRRSANPRVRSLTLGSTDSEPGSLLESFRHQKRRSQVFDMSPSSSDNEDFKGTALLRVQRRRQSSRRMSNISLTEGGPIFRPLDVLVCEDHPVSKLVMERLLEKLRCRTICVDNGAEAMRYAMGEVKFDIILMEFKLPQINGEDVARMIRSSKNPNSNTPIVAVTGYLKDLSDPHHFTELIEKPATPAKLIDVLERNCNWKPPNAERPTLADRKESLSTKKPSGSGEESGRVSPTVEKFMSSHRAGPRFSEQFSSMDEDETASVASGTEPIMISRSTTNEWEKLYIGKNSIPRSSTPPSTTSSNAPQVAGFAHHETAPPRLHSSSIERMPSPLSTHISTGMLDNIPPPLPSPPETTPLPPSLASTPIFSTPAADRPRSPLSIASAPAQSKTPPPSMERLKNMLAKRSSPPRRTRSPSEELAKKSPPKNFSRINPPSPTKAKEPLGPSMMNSSPSSPESKVKAKRTSWEKKKDKQEKQQNQHLRPEDADADDELSTAGGKRPSKSKSISEIITRVRRGGVAPEMKRSKSDKGESSEGNSELGGALGGPPEIDR